MPIKPENKDLYPDNWGEISNFIRFTRAGGKCEGCGVVHGSWINKHTREICLQDEDNAIRVILTTAHLDHNPVNCEHDNLKAWCQKCHNSYDAPHRKQTRRNAKLVGQLKIM